MYFAIYSGRCCSRTTLVVYGTKVRFYM